jgi:hypothetical protein
MRSVADAGLQARRVHHQVRGGGAEAFGYTRIGEIEFDRRKDSRPLERIRRERGVVADFELERTWSRQFQASVPPTIRGAHPLCRGWRPHPARRPFPADVDRGGLGRYFERPTAVEPQTVAIPGQRVERSARRASAAHGQCQPLRQRGLKYECPMPGRPNRPRRAIVRRPRGDRRNSFVIRPIEPLLNLAQRNTVAGSFQRAIAIKNPDRESEARFTGAETASRFMKRLIDFQAARDGQLDVSRAARPRIGWALFHRFQYDVALRFLGSGRTREHHGQAEQTRNRCRRQTFARSNSTRTTCGSIIRNGAEESSDSRRCGSTVCHVSP